MKKKISSLLAVIFVLFVGVFASACGNKYKNFEFKVYYAFSEDATEWFDGTEGISLNYNENDVLEDGEKQSSLIFNEGKATLFVKVEVEGVKAKHIDTISVSATALGGLDFAGATVHEGEVFPVSITGIVNTTFKIYENNSGNRFETKFQVMKELESIQVAPRATTPALLLGQNSSLNLLGLNNLIYLPQGQTNQTGVTYSIEGIGSFNNDEFIQGNKDITNIFSIKNGILGYLVNDTENTDGGKFKIDKENYVLKIKATSIFHQGTEEENYEDEISCSFYVCLANTMSQPEVQFANNLGGNLNPDENSNKVETVYLYKNGNSSNDAGGNELYNYSTSYINIGPMYDKVYDGEGGRQDVEIAFYVNIAEEGQSEQFIKYDFSSGNNEIVSKAGIVIERVKSLTDGFETFKLGMADVELIRKNKVKVVYEIAGLDFTCCSKKPGETAFKIEKHVVPNSILVNNELLEDSAIDVYYTTAKYDGARMGIVATPNENANRELVLKYNKNIELRDAYKNLITTSVDGEIATSVIKSGSTIYVKFKPGHSSNSDQIEISTFDMGNYDGGYITVGSITKICKLNKVVTANSMTFVDANNKPITTNGELLVNAANTSEVLLRVDFPNGALDKKSIKLTSGNSSVKFTNGLNEITLDEIVDFTQPVIDGNNAYQIFSIPMAPTETAQTSVISANAVGITTCDVKLKSVVVATEQDLEAAYVSPVNESELLSFANGYAIKRGDSVAFELKNANWAFELTLSSDDRNNALADDDFDFGAVSLTKSGSSRFIVKGNISNKTAIIKITPVYYDENLTIPENRTSFEIQVAVYDPIVKIDYAYEGNNTLSYINAFYKDISSVTFTFTGKTAYNGTPTSELVFKKENGENDVIENFSQIAINLEITDRIKVYLNDSLIEDGVIVGIKGSIKVELLAEENSSINSSVILTPCVKKGEKYEQGTPTVVGINIKDAVKSKNLSVSGSNLNEDNAVLNLSFMNVTSGGYDQKTIYATLEMEDGSINTNLNRDLTYLVYKYVQLDDGSFVMDGKDYRLEKVNNNAITLDMEGNRIIIRAFKDFGGGRYVLVLAPKDAYMGSNVEDVSRQDFAGRSVELDLNVRDGSEIAPYQIANYNDLMSINQNISQVGVCYELTNNLDLSELSFAPLGLVGTGINKFQGTLNGEAGVTANSGSTSVHTIYFKATQAAESGNYGYISGLFAMLGEHATIKNLNIVVDFRLGGNYNNIGALAGVNEGTITNVNVSINSANTINLGASSTNFGGIVAINDGTISASSLEMVRATKINTSGSANIGLVAGINTGRITGNYEDKDDLDDFIFDVLANLEVVNDASGNALSIGGVAGGNTGSISNILVGGKINLTAKDSSTNPNGYLGGIAGTNGALLVGSVQSSQANSETNNGIYTVAVLALDLVSEAKGVDVAGVAAYSQETINYAKFITAQVVFDFGQSNGQIAGLGNVAGIVAKADGAVVEYSSVESFVFTKVDEADNNAIYNYPTIVNNSTDANMVAAGLVATGSASVSKSFVKANLKGSNIYLLSNNSVEDSYFIGHVEGYKENALHTENATYYVLYNFAQNSVIADTVTSPNTEGVWGTDSGINKVGDKDYSYLVYKPEGKDEFEPLMVLAPQSISAALNQTYTVKPGSVYVEEFDISLYENQIKETILVNYFNNAGNEGNTHNLVNDDQGKGLIDITKVPAMAQMGLRFEIKGNGYRYAYINEKNQIVFTGASGQTPILVRVYSIFNTDVESYVVFYSQILASEITLGAESINLYTGMGGRVLSMQAKNLYGNIENSTLFNAGELKQYLLVKAEIKDKSGNNLNDADEDLTNDSKLILSISSYSNIFVAIKENQTIGANEYEEIILSLYLDKEYYNNSNGENIPFEDDVKLATMVVRVNLYNVASSVTLTGDNEEMPTNGDVAFKAYLNTDYISTDPNKTFTSEMLNEGMEEGGIVNKDKTFVVKEDNDDGDAIKVQFNVVGGEIEANKLMKRAGVEYFIDLFDIVFVRSLNNTEETTLGYTYDVQAELKDLFDYRYITSNIVFQIKVMAESNEDVFDTMLVTLKPTMATTLSFRTYAVQSLKMNTDYTSLVTSENEESLIIEPGKLGNIFLINIQPAYALIDYATITSSELYVPSLNRNVRMLFTQLVNRNNEWTTTLGGNTQQGNTLELKNISYVDSTGKEVYDGRICLYVQVENFSGLAGNLTATLTVKTSSGDDEETLVRSKMLTTTYLPGVSVLYDANQEISNGRYYIQEGTSDNTVDIKIQGYQFNADPIVTFSWVKKQDGQYVDMDADDDLVKGKLIGDYVSWYFINDKSSAVYSAIDDSYTISLRIAVAKDMPCAFAIKVSQSLVGKDGAITTAVKKTIFHPVDYFLNSLYVTNMNLEINQTDNFNLVFKTENLSYNPVNEVLELLANAYGDEFETKLKGMFTYYKDGSIHSFAEEHEEFAVEYDEITKTISLHGLKTFSSVVNFAVDYYYLENDNDNEKGTYSIRFDTNESPLVKSTSFNLDIVPIDTEVEVLVREAKDIFENGAWKLQAGANYVLLNDITLKDITPITTPIKTFDGNNRTITIESFKVNDSTSNYGLFAELSDATTLKNMMVDYSKFDTLALNNNTTEEVVFGGLVAVNNGGLIYNCDVINKEENESITIIVSNTTDVVFGGLVGKNAGVITNSRVGRSEYTLIQENAAAKPVALHGVTFNIYNELTEEDDNINNRFNILAGGFVGENTGTISTSYVTNTNLFNYSNANTTDGTNQTAGFVARNSGNIQYSYVRADENTITYRNPYATGYEITNKGNGIVAGFVYENSGKISNAYANTELKTDSAYIAGFVYINSGAGEISESYAACTMNAGILDNNAKQPFIGLNEKNELQSFGKIENAYYLTRSENDTPIKQGDKDIAYGLDYTNIQNSEYLVGFAFVLTNTKQEREQGIWSYYSIDSKQRALPELINADKISHSYRYLKTTADGTEVLTNVAEYKPGNANNPYTVSTAEEFNKVFKANGEDFAGYVRIINNIDFEGLSVQTRTGFVLGKSGEATSVEGNGLTISNIYLEADKTTLEKIGLFAEIESAYVKNLNLNFVSSQAGDQFSTTTAKYSGGLAGKINNSVILNINLDGRNTTLTGNNFVGGLAGMVTGDSLLYGETSNISTRATATGDGLYYSKEDYEALNVSGSTALSYENYLKTLSYAGGIAGVIDINPRANTDYNIQYVDVLGSEMSTKQNQGSADANILAEYAGGVAGYAGRNTSSYRLRYFTGNNELIVGDTAVGGIYGVLLGDLKASQVTADPDTQFNYDTIIGEYVTALYKQESEAALNKEEIGNLSLLKSNKYAGGVVGVAAGATMQATYAKVGIGAGSTIGGLVGSSISSIVNYSYAIPYVDVQNIPTQTTEGEDIKVYIGGLLGAAHSISSTDTEVGRYINLLKYHREKNTGTDIQFTYSTLVVDNMDVEGDITMDFVAANFKNENDITMLQSNATQKLVYVFAGTVDYTAHVSYEKMDGETSITSLVKNETNSGSNESEIMELHKMFPKSDEDVDQQLAFQDVFSAWSVVKYWSLKKEKYFPLLENDVVDNLIKIESSDDLSKITNNPDADFIITNDITVDPKEANWVISTTFTGTITGATEDGKRRPVITVQGLTANTTNETMGFFRETRNAKITNLEIVWGGGLENSKKGGFNIPENDMKITTISGFVCEDENSLISNVMVSGLDNGEDNAGYFLDLDENRTITGVAGIVGNGNRTNIMGCTFAGKVNAHLQGTNSVYVGGIAGQMKTNELDADITQDIETQNAIVANSITGVSMREANIENTRKYPTTEFNLTISGGATTYIGGLVGYAEHVGFNNSYVGGATNDSVYEDIKFNLTFKETDGNVNFGGVVGLATRGLVSGCKAVIDLTAVGTINAPEESGNDIKFGGLVGTYSQDKDNTGISDSSTRTKMKFVKNGETLVALGNENTQTNIKLSSGVADLGGNSIVEKSLFTGEINTEGASLKNVYAGAIAAFNNTGDVAKIREVNTNTVLVVGTTETEQLYAGGIIGSATAVTITNCANWGRIVPISANTAEVFVGGMIGRIDAFRTASSSEGLIQSQAETRNENKLIKVENAYSASSIITDSIGPKAIETMKIGALLGGATDEVDEAKVEFNKGSVVYSSDLALTPEENEIGGLSEIKNYSAITLLSDPNWQDEFIALDQDVWKHINSSLPYLIYLEDVLKEYNILTPELGTGNYNFEEGSILRPKTITSGNIAGDSDQFIYYLLNNSSNESQDISFTNLSGMVIGSENDIKLSSALVNTATRHSAVTNVHATIEGVFSSEAVIAVTNNGIIYNCSVQGTGVTSGVLKGVIAAINEGMISHSYSGIEVKGNGASGIVANNENGKLLSNYFTGYIESGSMAYGITANAGVEKGEETTSYMFNNYMGGVINSDSYTGGNSNYFAGIVSGNIAGSGNYIDSFADVRFKSSLGTDSDAIKAVSTSALMAQDVLKGNWHYAANCDGEDGLAALNTGAVTFGYNFNYPVYNFKKVDYGTGEENYLDTKHLLYTGTGENFKDGAGIEIYTGFEDRYDSLLSGDQTVTRIENDAEVTYNVTNYSDSFKISHLGVLSSALSLVDNDGTKNFMFIYDIDGRDVHWKYEGNDEFGVKVNGFKTIVFSGVVVSHNYYDFNSTLPASQETAVTIENINNHGLFNVVEKAYFGNITLGNFGELSNSGALAVSTTSAGGDLTEIVTNNINFVSDATISGASGENNHFGTLFGSVEQKLVVKNYNSGNVSLSAGDQKGYVGLIAGSCSGEIVLHKDTEGSSTFFSRFIGGGHVGGVVGLLNGGTIYGEGNKVSVGDNSQNSGSSAEENPPSFIGGIAGASEGGNIYNVNIDIKGSHDDRAIINANGFGGVVGEAMSGDLNVGSNGSDQNGTETSEEASGDIKISLNGCSTIVFVADQNKDSNYYGMSVGLINGGNVQVNQFAFDLNGFKILVVNDLAELEDDGLGIAALNEGSAEDSTKSGIGAFVGAMNSGCLEFGETEFALVGLTIRSQVVANIGGIIGLYSGGDLDLGVNFDTDGEQIPLILEGSTNVGGVIGYVNGSDLRDVTVSEGEERKDLLFSENPFATIHCLPGKNYGGLIGRWDIGSLLVNEEILNPAMLNRNKIYMEYTEVKGENVDEISEYAENVGGVVGKLIGAKVANLQNAGDIYYGNWLDAQNHDSISNMANNTDGQGKYTAEASDYYVYLQSLNVGGVIGYAAGVEISAIQNSGSIAGYQNVGGLVGSFGLFNEKYTTLMGCGITFSEEGSSLAYTADSGLNAEVVSSSSGDVAGVINVGGAVGLVNGAHTISGVATNANVYGHVAVGGLVGAMQGAEFIINNAIGIPASDEDASGSKFEVKGMYYNSYVLEEGGAKPDLEASFIPTAVGGIFGVAGGGSGGCEIRNNIVAGVNVTSADEGASSQTGVRSSAISIVQNNMINVWDSQEVAITEGLRKIVTNDKINYAETKSGFGGLVGAAYNIAVNNTTMVDISVNSKLGVNVGAYFGVFKGTNKNFGKVSVYGENAIDGAYNIGGLIGFFDCSDGGGSGSGGPSGISDADINGPGKIVVQSKLSGMYVGGLIGRTNYGTFSNLSIKGNNIVIHTSENYYVGGLVGRAETTGGAINKLTFEPGTGGTKEETPEEETTTSAQISTAAEIETKSTEYVIGDESNFGGLIGMLKIAGYTNGNGSQVTVNGEHGEAFTINTIENSNYTNGEPRYFSKEDETTGEIKLSAESRYINKDMITVSAGNGGGKHKEYSGFKRMQRCIPKDQNPQGEWDSVTTIFDAGNILAVGTGDDGSIIYTVYAQSENMATLYSRIGIASIARNYDASSSQMFDTLQDARANTGTAIFNMVVDNQEILTYYIDANNEANGLENLDYVQYGWNGPDGKSDYSWKSDYKTLGNKDGEISNRSFQSDNSSGFYNMSKLCYFIPAEEGDSSWDATYKGEKGAYFIFEVLFDNASLEGLKYKDDKDGTELTLRGYTDNYLPKSGSIYDCGGTYRPETADALVNAGDVDWEKIVVQVVIIVGELVLFFFTCGGSAAITAGAQSVGAALGGYTIRETLKALTLKGAVKFIAKQVVGTFSKSFLKTCAKGIVKGGIKATLKRSAKLVLTMTVSQVGTAHLMDRYLNDEEAAGNFTTPSSASYGYLASSYVRDISYEEVDGKIIAKDVSDDTIPYEYGETYYFYSYDRPEGFHEEYLGAVVEKTGTYYTLKTEDLAGESKTLFEPVDIEEYEEPELVDWEDSTSGDKLPIRKNKNKDEYRYVVKKYIYENGGYYINQYGGDLLVEPTSLTQLFKPEYDDGFGNIKQHEEPNYLNVEGVIYNRGRFAYNETTGKEEYYYYDENGETYNENLIKYDGSSYSLHGDSISNVERTHTLKYKYVPKGNTDPALLDGYTRFNTVYYTLGGYTNTGLTRKYAYVKAVTNPSGTKGLDYIEGSYITQEPYTYEDEDGNIQTGTRDVTKPCYWRLQGGGFETGRESEALSQYGGAKTSGWIEVGPSTFVNPYNGTIPAGAKVNACFIEDKNGTLSFAPTYYLWEGGYTVHPDEPTMVYLQADYENVAGTYNLKKYSFDANGNIVLGGETATVVTLANIVEGWESKSYKEWWCIVDSSGEPLGILDEMYQVINNQLFAYESSYTTKDGVLHKNVLSLDRGERANNGMYLTNSKYMFYTRYDYGNDLTNPPNSDWEEKGYSLFPQEGTTVNGGTFTRFSESVNIILGGKGTTLRVYDGDLSAGGYGYIKVS